MDHSVDVFGHAGIVGDHHHGHAKSPVHFAQQIEDFPGHLAVQFSGGFIGQQQGGPVGQAYGDGYPLLLSTGKLRWKAAGFILDS